MEHGTGSFEQNSVIVIMKLALPSDTCLILAVCLPPSSLFAITKPPWHVAMLVYSKMFEEYVLPLPIHSVIYRKVGLILTILKVGSIDRIWLFVEEFHSMGCKPCAYFLLLFAFSINGIAIHVAVWSHDAVGFPVFIKVLSLFIVMIAHGEGGYFSNIFSDGILIVITLFDE